MDTKDEVVSPLKKKRTTLKQVQTGGEKPTEYMYESKGEKTPANVVDEAKKQFDKEVAKLNAKA